MKLFPNGRSLDEFCKQCGLYKLCKYPRMNGEGTYSPIWLFAGEAPGETEDERGMPFIGEAGLLLRELIESVGIDIQKCRFTNIIRCRPPNNSLKPFPKAAEYCRVHLLREIRATDPKVVVLVGGVAIGSMLGKTGVLKLNGEIFQKMQRFFVCMIHPSYALRNGKSEEVMSKLRKALITAKKLGNPQKIKESTQYNLVRLEGKQERLGAA